MSHGHLWCRFFFKYDTPSYISFCCWLFLLVTLGAFIVCYCFGKKKKYLYDFCYYYTMSTKRNNKVVFSFFIAHFFISWSSQVLRVVTCNNKNNDFFFFYKLLMTIEINLKIHNKRMSLFTFSFTIYLRFMFVSQRIEFFSMNIAHFAL